MHRIRGAHGSTGAHIPEGSGGTMDFLTTSPIWIPFVIIVMLPTGLAMAGPFLTRRCIALDELKSNNEVAGFKFAVIGVIYGVLLAFAVIVVWERYTDADVQVAHEAGAATTIYRLSDGLDEATGQPLRETLTFYLRTAIERDWPAMEKGEDNPDTTAALDALYARVVEFSPRTDRESQIMYELLYELDQLTEARRNRLVSASGHVPGMLWAVLLGGGLLTVSYTLFFGNRNLRAQSMMTGMLTLLITSVLLVVIGIDRPFAGIVRVEPEALVAVARDFGH